MFTEWVFKRYANGIVGGELGRKFSRRQAYVFASRFSQKEGGCSLGSCCVESAKRTMRGRHAAIRIWLWGFADFKKAPCLS
jgi:hypothetical protein